MKAFFVRIVERVWAVVKKPFTAKNVYLAILWISGFALAELMARNCLTSAVLLVTFLIAVRWTRLQKAIHRGFDDESLEKLFANVKLEPLFVWWIGFVTRLFGGTDTPLMVIFTAAWIIGSLTNAQTKHVKWFVRIGASILVIMVFAYILINHYTRFPLAFPIMMALVLSYAGFGIGFFVKVLSNTTRGEKK